MHGSACVGVVTEAGEEIGAGRVVLTTGTFLRGLIHIGEITMPAGRARGQRDGVPADLAADAVEPPSTALAQKLQAAASGWAVSRPARRRGSTAARSTTARSSSRTATSRRSPSPI